MQRGLHRAQDKCTATGSGLMAERAKIVPFISDGAWLMRKLVNNQVKMDSNFFALAFPASRAKFLPPWLVFQVGQLSQALETKQFNGPGYVEVDIDIDAFKSTSPFTRIAKPIIAAVQPQLTKLVLDLGILAHGEFEDELPERLLGGVVSSPPTDI